MRHTNRVISAIALVAVAAGSIAAQGGVPRGPLAGRGPIGPGGLGPAAQGRMGIGLGRQGLGPRGQMLGWRRFAMQGRGAGRMVQGGRPFARQAMRDRMIAQRAVMQERIRNLTPAQREALYQHREAARAERERVVGELRAGKLTREQAREAMQKWRDAHKPPVDLTKPPGE